MGLRPLLHLSLKIFLDNHNEYDIAGKDNFKTQHGDDMVLTKLPGVTLATGLPAELVRNVEGRFGG